MRFLVVQIGARYQPAVNAEKYLELLRAENAD
jgi:hypothetical protein